MRTSILSRPLALPALSLSALANTYTVDDTPGPGVDFADIPAAIAFAQAGDVLIVRAGNYSGFVLDKALVIVGTLGASTSGPIEVRNVPAGPRVVVVAITTQRFVVDNCSAPVVLQELGNPSTSSITNSVDVRVARTTISTPIDDSLDALALTNSRLEFVDGQIRGHDAPPFGVPFGWAPGGGIAVKMSSARFVASKALLQGGGGSLEFTQGTQAGGGGVTLDMGGTSTGVLVGPGSTLVGSGGGVNWYYSECGYDACGGYGAYGVGNLSTLVVSGATTGLYPCSFGLHCITYTAPLTSGVQFYEPSTQPSLATTGVPTRGASITFVVSGEVGSVATLTLGRGFVVGPLGIPWIEALVPAGRISASVRSLRADGCRSG